VLKSEFERLHGVPLGVPGSQGGEEAVILKYFGDRIEAFMDVGAFDGISLSNTYALACRGWYGVCVEPDPVAVEALMRTDTDGVVEFHSSRGGAVSTTCDAHREKWAHANFDLIDVPSVTVETLLKMNPGSYAMLSVDVEGESVPLFEKFPLSDMKTELVVVEHDGQMDRVFAHANAHGLHRYLYRSAENVIIAK
jgi:hypothetical protein